MPSKKSILPLVLTLAFVFVGSNLSPLYGANDLFESAKKGDLTGVQVAIIHGADLGLKDDNGNTALIVASMYGHEDVVQLLLDNKADIDAKGKVGGLTALISASARGHKDVVQSLLNNKANVNAKSGTGNTALMYASRYGHKDIVQLLLDNKVNVNAKTDPRSGTTALMIATIAGHKDIVKLLKKHGAIGD